MPETRTVEVQDRMVGGELRAVTITTIYGGTETRMIDGRLRRLYKTVLTDYGPGRNGGVTTGRVWLPLEEATEAELEHNRAEINAAACAAMAARGIW